MVPFLSFVLSFFLVDGGLSEWSAWGTCSKDCGTGIRTRTKTCTNPSPQYGGNDCTGLGDAHQQEDCNTQNCQGRLYSHPGPVFLHVQRIVWVLHTNSLVKKLLMIYHYPFNYF